MATLFLKTFPPKKFEPPKQTKKSLSPIPPFKKKIYIYIFFLIYIYIYSVSHMRDFHKTGPLHCGTIQLNQTKEVPAAKADLGVESQPPPKQPFLTAITKITCPTKVEMLGTWHASILFRNSRPVFFLYRGALG